MQMKKGCLILSLFLSLQLALFAEEDPCPFCSEKVLKRQQVYENDYFRIILEHCPIIEGHLLVIPKRHIMKAHELTQEEGASLIEAIQKTVQAFRSTFDTDEYIVYEKNGPHAGQSVFHVHFHLIPVPKNGMPEHVKMALFAKLYQIVPELLDEEENARQVRVFRRSFIKE
jgi:diadenosine tetraphosphate (Ap4A) HIT family hydrolase